MAAIDSPQRSTAGTSGIYISYPFCEQKCTYCHFSSGVFPRHWERDYLDALIAEIDAAQYPAPPDTLYLGGGTPSRMEIPELERLLDRLPVSRWREATIEASPGTITGPKAQGWARLGITRVSLGVQSFVPAEAAAAGRKHTPAQVAGEAALLREAGIADISIDLLAGLAYQSEASWHESLDWIERIGPGHVSIYMLEVDDESQLGREIRGNGTRYGASEVPSDDEIASFYVLATRRLEAQSLHRYEISNFARPGRESLHNLKYWNMAPYLGFGADAHSFNGTHRWGNVAMPEQYIARWRSGQDPRRSVERIDESRRLEDRFLTGLRQSAGLRVTPDDLACYQESIEAMQRKGWIELRDGDTLRLTAEGVLFSNEVFQQFLLDPVSAGQGRRETA